MKLKPFVLAMLIAVAAAVPACALRLAPSGAAKEITIPSAGAGRPGTTVSAVTSGPPVAVPRPAVPVKKPKLPPAIFYSPHPDDESIGMGQAIRRAVRSGRPVYVVLLTDGEDSHAYEHYYLKHPDLWRDYDHDGDGSTRADFGFGRREEFIRATTDLGVPRDHLAFYGAAAHDRPDGLSRDFFPEAKVLAIMRSYEHRFPGALHVTVMKYTDGNPHGAGDAYPQQEHTAACEALRELVRLDHVRAEFYKVYVYDLPASERWAPHIENDAADHAAKVNALQDGYGRAESDAAHLGLGWASVPLNIRNDLVDTHEYRTGAADFQ